MENLDIYEVDKADYDAYFYRLPENEIMKTTPNEGFIVYKDIKDNGTPICGILSEEIMAMPATRYFIFNFLNEERLGQYKTYKYITLNKEEYLDFLAKLNIIPEDIVEND